eukprot:TRINITY_DN61034_c0_g1_i1.p1 TRINITY_DN61034_c0_g1~~TRINITY_DN61034_c0_g1_i1.p1  ORF type:complete len:859 (-),score=122.45 TRINITY_DN61034_c0_g1_i1:37-2307(-)
MVSTTASATGAGGQGCSGATIEVALAPAVEVLVGALCAAGSACEMIGESIESRRSYGAATRVARRGLPSEKCLLLMRWCQDPSVLPPGRSTLTARKNVPAGAMSLDALPPVVEAFAKRSKRRHSLADAAMPTTTSLGKEGLVCEREFARALGRWEWSEEDLAVSGQAAMARQMSKELASASEVIGMPKSCVKRGLSSETAVDAAMSASKASAARSGSRSTSGSPGKTVFKAHHSPCKSDVHEDVYQGTADPQSKLVFDDCDERSSILVNENVNMKADSTQTARNTDQGEASSSHQSVGRFRSGSGRERLPAASSRTGRKDAKSFADRRVTPTLASRRSDISRGPVRVQDRNCRASAGILTSCSLVTTAERWTQGSKTLTASANASTNGFAPKVTSTHSAEMGRDSSGGDGVPAIDAALGSQSQGIYAKEARLDAQSLKALRLESRRFRHEDKERRGSSCSHVRELREFHASNNQRTLAWRRAIETQAAKKRQPRPWSASAVSRTSAALATAAQCPFTADSVASETSIAAPFAHTNVPACGRISPVESLQSVLEMARQNLEGQEVSGSSEIEPESEDCEKIRTSLGSSFGIRVHRSKFELSSGPMTSPSSSSWQVDRQKEKDEKGKEKEWASIVVFAAEVDAEDKFEKSPIGLSYIGSSSLLHAEPFLKAAIDDTSIGGVDTDKSAVLMSRPLLQDADLTVGTLLPEKGTSGDGATLAGYLDEARRSFGGSRARLEVAKARFARFSATRARTAAGGR